MAIRYINNRWYYKCYACHARGKLWSLVQTIADFKDSADLRAIADELILADEESLPLTVANAYDGSDEWVRNGLNKQARVFPDGMLRRFLAWDIYPASAAYLGRKRVSVRAADHYGLLASQFDDRLLFPLRNREGKLVGVQGRSLLDPCLLNIPKYWQYWNCDKMLLVGGIDKINPKFGVTLVMEGFMDILPVWDWAMEAEVNLVFTLGAMISQQQADLLASSDTVLQFWFDQDDAGRRGWEEARRFIGKKAMGLSRATWEYKDQYNAPIDPGKMTKDQFMSVLTDTLKK